MSNNKRIKKILINKYGCFCMMTGIVSINLLTTINGKAERRKTSIQNGSNLSDEIHQLATLCNRT